MTHGVVVANCGASPGAMAGGVGRHWPGSVPPRYGGTVSENPSWLRHARISWATVCPQDNPCFTASVVSVMAAREAVSCWSNLAFWLG